MAGVSEVEAINILGRSAKADIGNLPATRGAVTPERLSHWNRPRRLPSILKGINVDLPAY